MVNPLKLEQFTGRQKVSELKAMGFKFVNIPGFNRPVDPKHVKELMASVREEGFFLDSIKVISAVEWFKYYPDRQITLESGEVLTKDTEGLDEILLILDGQHRYTADKEMGIEEDYVSTLTAELVDLPDSMTPDRWTTAVNSTSRNWTEKDRACFISTLNHGEESNVEFARQVRKEFGIGERAAYAFSMYSDVYRKSYYVEYMRHPEEELPYVLKGTDANRKRGWDTLHAMEVGFRNHPKAIKNMALIEFVIEVYNATPDINKADKVEQILTFFKSLPEDVAKSICEQNKVQRKHTLRKCWNKFQKDLKQADKKEDIEQTAFNAENEWANKMDNQKQRK